MTQDLTVYKYVGLDRVDVLANGLIRFTQVTALNDPFESRPNLNDLKQQFRNLGKGYAKAAGLDWFEASKSAFLANKKIQDRFKQWQQEQDKNYLFLSLSKNRNNLLMWSHYCSAHRGFVMGFDSAHAFFRTREFKRFSPLREVKYSERRPRVKSLLSESVDIVEIFMFTKSAHWAYEEELRMIASPNAAKQVRPGDDGNDIYLFEFPPESLREIIVGYRMPPENQLEVAELVQDRYPHAALFRAVLNPAEFDLDIIPFTPPTTKGLGI